MGYLAAKVKLTEWRLRNSKHLPKATPNIDDPVTNTNPPNGSQSNAPHASGVAAILNYPDSNPASVALSTLSPANAPMGTSSSSRRKNSMVSKSFLPPSTLTLTHDLVNMHPSPAANRSLAGSPRMHAASTGDLLSMTDFTLNEMSTTQSVQASKEAPNSLPPPPTSQWQSAAPCNAPSNSILSTLAHPVEQADTLLPHRARSNSQDDLSLYSLTKHQLHSTSDAPQPPLRRLYSESGVTEAAE